jgi:hypothetical protein
LGRRPGGIRRDGGDFPGRTALGNLPEEPKNVTCCGAAKPFRGAANLLLFFGARSRAEVRALRASPMHDKTLKCPSLNAFLRGRRMPCG